MHDLASRAGLSEAVIINSCAVTAEAVRQTRQSVRRARKDNPGSTIIVTGCAAQIAPDDFAAMPEVDYVIGNHEKVTAGTFDALAAGDCAKVQVGETANMAGVLPMHTIAGFGSRTRAYVQIQNGCDHDCTFCIIPAGRGKSRSMPVNEIIEQVRKFVCEAGFREVVLTGVDITAYGADLPKKQKLGALVGQVLEAVPELVRLRISSIDALESDQELLEIMGAETRLMPHLHLSLQSGDDIILKRMKRRHTRHEAIEFCARLREMRPDMVFGADFICGFPTETEEMFANTVQFVDECKLTWLHVFPFSPRKGTPAAKMPQLPKEVVKQRVKILRQKADELLQQHLGGYNAGDEVSVLLERENIGRTPQFTPVRLVTPGKAGEIAAVEILGIDGEFLMGRSVDR
jgi:threonylcarbamoyladenosine tRNA methylthiotransferase MtaB